MIETFFLRTYQVVLLAVIFPLIILVFTPILAVMETSSNLIHLFRCFLPGKEHQPFSRQRTPEFEALLRKQNEARIRLNAFLNGSQENEPLFEDFEEFQQKLTDWRKRETFFRIRFSKPSE